MEAPMGTAQVKAEPQWVQAHVLASITRRGRCCEVGGRLRQAAAGPKRDGRLRADELPAHPVPPSRRADHRAGAAGVRRWLRVEAAG